MKAVGGRKEQGGKVQRKKDHVASLGQMLPAVRVRSPPGATGCFRLVQVGTQHPRSRCCCGGPAAANLSQILGFCHAEEAPQLGGTSQGLWCHQAWGNPSGAGGMCTPPGSGCDAARGAWAAAHLSPWPCCPPSTLLFKWCWLIQTCPPPPKKEPPLAFQSSKHPETPENPSATPAQHSDMLRGAKVGAQPWDTPCTLGCRAPHTPPHPPPCQSIAPCSHSQSLEDTTELRLPKRLRWLGLWQLLCHPAPLGASH